MKTIYLSHSNDGVLSNCPRKFEFMYLWKKFPPAELIPPNSTVAADVGTAVHEAAQEWIRARQVEGLSNEAALDRAYYALLRFWDLKNETTKRPLGAAVALLEKMSQDPFWDEWQICNIDNYGPAIEVSFNILHNNLRAEKLGYRFITQGKLDLIMKHRHTGEYRCVDFKTTSFNSRLWEAQYRYSDQGPVYSFPLQAVAGLPIGDPLQVTYYMLSFVKEETIPGDPRTEEVKVGPATYTYDRELLTEMWATKHERIRRMTNYLETDLWPRATHGCLTWNQPCRFLSVCHERDSETLRRWFMFEQWETKTRTYDPIWTFQEDFT